jgi:hypothetical protein
MRRLSASKQRHGNCDDQKQDKPGDPRHDRPFFFFAASLLFPLKANTCFAEFARRQIVLFINRLDRRENTEFGTGHGLNPAPLLQPRHQLLAQRGQRADALVDFPGFAP